MSRKQREASPLVLIKEKGNAKSEVCEWPQKFITRCYRIWSRKRKTQSYFVNDLKNIISFLEVNNFTLHYKFESTIFILKPKSTKFLLYMFSFYNYLYSTNIPIFTKKKSKKFLKHYASCTLNFVPLSLIFCTVSTSLISCRH
jgi:hypothetical protein